MQKISAADAQVVISEASKALRMLCQERDKLASANRALKEKVASYELRDRVEKVSSVMAQKGIEAGMSQEERIQMLREKAKVGQLDVIEQAVELAASGSPLGRVSDGPSGSSENTFLGYILGDSD